MPYEPVLTTSAPSASLTGAFPWGGWGSAGFDWVTGTTFARSSASDGDHSSGSANVVATDEFVVDGIATGIPLTIHARIRVQGSSGGSPNSYSATGSVGWVEHASVGRVDARTSGGLGYSESIDEFRVLDVPAITGTPFLLTIGAHSYAQEASGEVRVSLHFVNLPTGATIRSCKGYSVSPVVPVRRMSWGDLKLRFR